MALSLHLPKKTYFWGNYKNGKCTEFGQCTGNFTVI